MYRHENRFARGTLASAVRNSFVGANTQLSDDLMKYVDYHWLKDMFDWTRAEFDKGVIIRAKKKLSFNRNFNVIKLGKVAIIKKGKSITTTQRKEGNIKVVAGGRDYAYLHNEANRTADVITISASGAYAGFVNYWDEPIFASDCNTVQGDDKMQTLFFIITSFQYKIIFILCNVEQPNLMCIVKI